MPPIRRRRTPEQWERELVSHVTEQMKASRERAGMGREEMAVKLQVDFNTIGRWERGEGKDGPPLWAVVGYARYTATPVREIVEGSAATPAELRLALVEALRLEREAFDRRMVLLERRFAEGLSASDASAVRRAALDAAVAIVAADSAEPAEGTLRAGGDRE